MADLTTILTSAGIASVVTTVMTTVVNAFERSKARQAEHRRQIRELGFKSGMDEWREAFEVMKLSNGRIVVNPPLAYIHFQIAVAEAISDPDISEEELRDRLTKAYRRKSVVNEAIQKASQAKASAK